MFLLEQGLPGRLKGDAPRIEGAELLDRKTVREMADSYLKAVRALAPDARRVADKAVDNFRRLGLIALLFPAAAIVHCRRDPLDVCVSCYLQPFGPGKQPYSYDSGLLGAYYREYERLMAHWHEVLPGRIVDIGYEDLVADQEGVSRRIVEHCGLDWDDSCLAFHRHERAVLTASYWQVRQPLYSTSVGRWRRYEKHLEPLRAALGLRSH